MGSCGSYGGGFQACPLTEALLGGSSPPSHKHSNSLMLQAESVRHFLECSEKNTLQLGSSQIPFSTLCKCCGAVCGRPGAPEVGHNPYLAPLSLLPRPDRCLEPPAALPETWLAPCFATAMSPSPTGAPLAPPAQKDVTGMVACIHAKCFASVNPILAITLRGRTYSYFCLIDEETETEAGRVTCFPAGACWSWTLDVGILVPEPTSEPLYHLPC